jgi:hypothetical protein
MTSDLWNICIMHRLVETLNTSESAHFFARIVLKLTIEYSNNGIAYLL